MQLTLPKKIHGLYAITDTELMYARDFHSKLRQALEGGARIVQYRDKSNHHEQRLQQTQQLVGLCKQYDAISIINDDVELVKVTGADGVHIGIEDESLLAARQQLGADKIIGVSCYADIERAKIAIENSADYVAFGSIFASLTKPQKKITGLQVLKQAKRELNVPIVAIGGIDLDNVDSVIAAGADSIAVISAVFGAEKEGSNRTIKQKASQFSQAFLTS